MPEIYKSDSPSGKFLRDDGTWNAVGAGSFSGTMDDIPNGTIYVKTENNYSDADKTIVDGVTAALAGKAPSLGVDDNYVTDAEKTKLANLSGTNSGDQDLSGLVVKNIAITGATKTKVTYDTKGLITSGADATTADIADSADKRYCTDAQKTVIGNTSGTNSGNETTSTLGATINGSVAATPNDTDLVATVDTSVVKKITWTNVKAFLKTYFDGFYATITNLNLKAPIDSPTFTGTVSGITATMVGLGSVNNTSDAAKPVSTAQQTALDLKANLASPTLTGTPLTSAPSAGTNTTQIATTAYSMAAAPNPSYRTILDSSGSHTAAKVLGTVVVGSNGASVATPAADSSNNLVGSDFALPADGNYVIGVVTTATVATSAHVHISASLQLRNA